MSKGSSPFCIQFKSIGLLLKTCSLQGPVQYGSFSQYIWETKNSAPSEFQPHLIRLLTWRQQHRPSDFKTLRKTQWPKASLLNLFPHSFKVVSSFYKFSLFIFRSKAEVVLQQRLPAPQHSHFKYKCLIQCLITAVIQYGFIADM